MRVFFDTNVLVSAFTARGLCADLYRIALLHHDLIVGEFVLQELDRVLRTRFHVSAAQAAAVRAHLAQRTVVPMPTAPSPIPVADPDDAWVLASAEAGEVELLVTGDSDLLAVADACEFLVRAPREAWDLLRGRG